MSDTRRRNFDNFSKDRREYSGGWTDTERKINRQERKKERHELKKRLLKQIRGEENDE